MKAFRSIFFAFLTVGAAAQAPPQASFSLLGDLTQKITYQTTETSSQPTSVWDLEAFLKPRWLYGPVSFITDATVDVPITASLVPTSPTIAVAEAYLRVTPVTGLDINFGQKRFTLGVGQTFTVGDSINPVIGFFDQKTGFRGASVIWSPTAWASGSAAISTEAGTPDRLIGVAQGSVLIDKFQATAALVAGREQTLNPSVGISQDLFGVIVTAEAAAEFQPAGLVPDSASPAAWTTRPGGAPIPSASGGVRSTVSWGDWNVTGSAEYLYWGQGWTKQQVDNWKKGVPVAAALATSALEGTRGIRDQHNAFIRCEASNGVNAAFQWFGAVDLQDLSLLSQSAATWTPWDNLDVIVTWLQGWGTPGEAWATVDSDGDRYQVSLATTYHF